MVDIVHACFAVDKADEIFDYLDEILLGEHAQILVGVQAELAVEAETSHVAEIVALLAEEELVDDVAGGVLIRRFRVAELLVDVVDRFDFGVCRVFLQGVEDDGVFARAGLVFLEQDALDVGVKDGCHGLLVENRIPLHDRKGPFDRDDLARILVLKVFGPGLQHFGREFASLICLQALLVHGNFVGKVEDIDDVLVGVEADGAQKRGYGELFLTVDVGEHHIVDVAGELYPGTLDGDDPCGIELCSVGVHGLVEEHAGGTVELRNDDAFRAVDNECAARGHVGDVAEIHVLYLGIEILMFRVGARKAEFCLQGNTV